MGCNSSRRAEEMAQLRKEISQLVDLQTSHLRMAEEMTQLCKEMRAEREAQRDKEISQLVDLQTSHLRMAEEIAQLRKEMMAEREAQRDKERSQLVDLQTSLLRMAMGSIKTFDSGVSLKSDWSNGRLFDFIDRVSPSGLDFSSSKEEHVVADDDDLYEFPDDLGGDDPGPVV